MSWLWQLDFGEREFYEPLLISKFESNFIRRERERGLLNKTARPSAESSSLGKCSYYWITPMMCIHLDILHLIALMILLEHAMLQLPWTIRPYIKAYIYPIYFLSPPKHNNAFTGILLSGATQRWMRRDDEFFRSGYEICCWCGVLVKNILSYYYFIS